MASAHSVRSALFAARGFCNSDQPDFPYIIRIEGLSADGRPFSRHCLVEP